MTKGAAQETGLDDLAKDFIVENNAYYQTAFAKIQRAEGVVFSWNTMAAVFGPLWGALRGCLGFFLGFYRFRALCSGADWPRVMGRIGGR